LLPAVNAVNHALKETESSVRVTIASRSARVDSAATSTRVSQRQRRLGAPLRRREPRVRGQHRDEREQHGFDDGHPAIASIVLLLVGAIVLSTMLPVLGDLLFDLCC
jgi:hypothetical protein